jgi:arylsulfatase A-like enzyme
MHRFLFTALVTFVYLPPVLFAAPPAPRPNIVFILADDLGYGDVGCYGQKLIQTPNIDHLAAEGRLFTQCYAGCTVCAPSRCSLMTGLHTGHAWIRGNLLVPLRPQDRTVAEVLHSAGYQTVAIGKWGLGEPGSTGIPNRKGFDEWFGYLNQLHAHNYYPSYLWKNEKRLMLEGNQDVRGVSVKRAQYSQDLFTREALAYLDRPPKEPFFLYLAYTIPHANNEAGEAHGMEVPNDAPYSDRPWTQPQKNRAAMITRLDTYVGKVLKKIKERGLEDKTLVFFTSDNGPSVEGGSDPAFFHSSGPFRGIKRDLYEGGIRMPMIARWPGHIQPGTTSDQVWAFWDFLPTAADLAGAPVPPGLDGISMVHALEGLPQTNHEFLYWEFHEQGFHQAVRMGDWKYVRYPRRHAELYDLKTDPGETKDVASEHSDVMTKIEQYLKRARTQSRNWPVRP